MRLHGYFRSGTSHRVRIALHLKGIPFEYAAVSLPQGMHRTESFKSLNPQQLVPVLETTEGVITQSVAILEYLEERYPAPALLPGSTSQRARVRSLAAVIGSDIHPLNNLRVLTHLRLELNQNEVQVQAWIARWIHEGFAALEAALLTGPADGPFCVGKLPTLADVYLIPQMFSARRFNVALDAYPRLLAIDAACAQLPAFAAAHPQLQPDAG